MSGASSRIQTERSQRTLLELANQPGNDVCADCKARAPRWASYSIGIFICVNCASIHRKIGTHITKVKSLTLDTWTKEQVEHMRQNGNLKSNAKFNPDETRHPPPTNLIDSERDSELEKFIRAKYEFQTFMKPVASPAFGRFPPKISSKIDRSAAVAALLGPSRSAASRLSPSPSFSTSTVKADPTPSLVPPPVPRKTPAQTHQTSSAPAIPTSVAEMARNASRSVSQPVLAQSQHAQHPSQLGGVWGELQTLQSKTIDATLPLQIASFQQTSAQSMAIPPSTTPSFLSTPSPFGNLSVSPSNPFPSMLSQSTGISPNSIGRSASLGSGLSSIPAGSSYQGSLTPFQSSSLATSHSLTPVSGTPSPNPFAPQALPYSGAQAGYNGISGLSASPQPSFAASTPFGSQQPVLAQQHQQSSQLFQQSVQRPVFQPQPQLLQSSQLQVPNASNPYIQMQASGMPYMTAQPYVSTPSPFASAQPLPQMQMQQPQQAFGTANPFTSWVQQPPNQQQWGM